jgi:predicted PhzF superfamily epimerase YddE/YHI9
LTPGLLQVKICGHATLAAAHTLFTSSLLNSNVIEFVTVSGTLTARKVPEIQTTDDLNIQNRESHESFLIELDFPTIPMIDFNSAEFSSISNALNGASVIDIKRTTTEDDLIVILPSGETVAELEPQFDLIRRCPGRGIIISGAAPLESGFDYYYRFFCPKFRVNEVKYVWHLVSSLKQCNVPQELYVIYQSLFHLFIVLITYF